MEAVAGNVGDVLLVPVRFKRRIRFTHGTEIAPFSKYVKARVRMTSTLFLIFNHEITPTQEADARASIGVARIVPMPDHLQALWSNVPPDLREINEYLEPLRRWLESEARPGDYALIQGDFGACYLLVRYVLEQGLVPVYSTTERTATEETHPDGTVRLTHEFRHRIFRTYGR
jgi:hypothetical protein